MICLTPNISKNFSIHLEGGALLVENVFRYGSIAWGSLIREARGLYNRGLLDDLDVEDYAVLNGQTAEFAAYMDSVVMLEVPERLEDGAPGYYVYVLDEAGEVKRLEFQDETVTL